MVKEPHGKFLICIENAKIEKIKTYFSSKIVSKENYVFLNAKYVCWGEIKNFPWEKYFFPKSEIHIFSRVMNMDTYQNPTFFPGKGTSRKILNLHRKCKNRKMTPVGTKKCFPIMSLLKRCSFMQKKVRCKN